MKALLALALILLVSGCTAPAALPPAAPPPAAPAALPEPLLAQPAALPEPPATPEPPPATPPAAQGPPLRIKSLPLVITPITADRAGDIVFTKQDLTFDRLFMEYGFVIPASSAGAEKANPQPTFLAPLGTKVRSLVDGVVVSIPTTWANDYSIHVAADEQSQYRYETEHVLNPLVKVGDRVRAGQVIAEVGDYDERNSPGYGLVEMGILKGGNPPEHLCPFEYLDPASSIGEDLTALAKAWNQYKGEQLHPTTAVPGCLTLDPIEG